jgi:hypothetical protein
MSDFYKVVPASCHCGGTQAWVKLRIDHAGVDEEMVGCICHNPLPWDAKIIGTYLDRPHRNDPMPLFDERALIQWKRRNALRYIGTEAYRRPPEL